MPLARVVALAAPALILGCGEPRAPDATLLFFHRSPTAQIGSTTWAPDVDHSRLIVFRGLQPERVVSGRAANPVAAAPLGPYVLVSELTGEGVVLDTTGALVREWQSPHPVAIYATSGNRVIAARSPYRVPTFLTEPATAPLLKVLDTLGRPLDDLATIKPVQLITEIANAGAVAAAGDVVYFAPMVDDEIRKYGPGGTLLWIARRGLPGRDADIQALKPPVVNIALAIGPNGRLYALGGDVDSSRLRLDVLDTASGQILATRTLGPRETAIAVSRRDSVLTFDADSLGSLAGAAEPREPFEPAFALPTPAGDTIRWASDRAGYVRLVNFWASWCGPCKEEFPRMGELAGAFAGQRFVIYAISDDVDRGAMTDFLRRYDPGNLVILAGAGRMKGVYHYRGLPYTLVVDRQGRVVERIFGFGGEREFARLRETIAKEVARP